MYHKPTVYGSYAIGIIPIYHGLVVRLIQL